MHLTNDKLQPIYSVEQDEHGIACIQLNPYAASPMTVISKLNLFLSTCITLLSQASTKALLFTPPFSSTEQDYKKLILDAKNHPNFEIKLANLLQKSASLQDFRKPIIGLISGQCTDINLACMLIASQRWASYEAVLGFPISNFGLFPGFGASIRLSRLLPLEVALPLLTQGEMLSAEKALEVGLINRIAADKDSLFEKAKQQLKHSKDAYVSAEAQSFNAEFLQEFSAKIKNITFKKGVATALALLRQNATVGLDTAFLQESKAFGNLLKQPFVVDQLRTYYYGVSAAREQPISKPNQPYQLQKIAILGAGMMGAGIAFQAAAAGLEVYIKDLTIPLAERAVEQAKKTSQKLVHYGKMTALEQEALLQRIHPLANISQMPEVNLCIEAVFEDKKLKAAVTQESMHKLKKEGIFASNTTSIPIHELAAALDDPSQFIGMHFFSPVERMPLVEIIRAKHSSEDTLAKALLAAHRLDKTPIVVNDSPGFFTSRIFFNYLLEGITMLLEGIPPADIEDAAAQAGFAIGPLAVLDEISLSLMLHVYDQLPALHISQQRAYIYLKKLVEMGRNGRKEKKGFYTYLPEQKSLWLDPEINLLSTKPAAAYLQKRLLHVMALDSYRCLDMGVLDRPIDGDIGSVLGVGFPKHLAGVFAYIDQVGLSTFLADCQQFEALGEHWEIPSSLRWLTQRNFKFYSGFESNWPLAQKKH